MKDMHSGIFGLMAIGAAVLAADNTPAAIDLQGYNGAEILLTVGVGGITFDDTNKVEFTLTHSDDDSTYVAVTDTDILGVSSISSGIIKSLVVAHGAAAVYRFGYVGNKRYLKLLANFSGTHGAGTPIAATVLAGKGHDNPQIDQA